MGRSVVAALCVLCLHSHANLRTRRIPSPHRTRVTRVVPRPLARGLRVRGEIDDAQHQNEPTKLSKSQRHDKVVTLAKPVRDSVTSQKGLGDKINELRDSIKPEVLAIMSVYFVQGILGLSTLATTFFFKDELHLPPAQVAALTGITSIPWVIKPLYGFISDTFPLLGFRRKSYLFLSGLLGSMSWLVLSQAVTTPTQAVAALTVASLSIAFSDVVVDSIAVERSRLSQAEAGTIQSLCWGSRYFGAGLTAYFSGELLEVISPRSVFLITAVFPLLVSVFSNKIQEKKSSLRPSNGNGQTAGEESIALFGGLKKQAGEVWEAARQPNVLLPMIFVLAWQATPNASTGFFYFLTNDLQFKPEFLGRLQVASSLASLVGVWLYQTQLKNIPIKKVLGGCTLLSVPVGLTQLILINKLNRQFGIPDGLFAMGDDVIMTALGEIAFMPLLVVAAKVCPVGIEGTLFATLMSAFNLAGIVSQELGAALTSYLGVTESNFDNLGLLVTTCSASSLLPLIFLNFLDRVSFDEAAEGTEVYVEQQEGDPRPPP
ncbi:hypothetical protein AAMO2058_000219200 [Amorphochlora amoebiformis]|mmetsp:Transcript_21378/g.33745  ORF Transcript_21378/g.33745 Transcript_21378/m.33745 type:complete len:545 (-) Transcript_21378:132-1766(-)